MGLRKGNDKARRAALMRIVFVCLGNICRSPAAEGVMRGLAPELELDSAGTAGWHAGDAPYGPMQDAASARDIDLRNLRARQFVAADFDRFDLIVAMDAPNKTSKCCAQRAMSRRSGCWRTQMCPTPTIPATLTGLWT